MFTMAVGHSDDIDPDAAVEAVAEECSAALGDVEPRAGLLFCTFDTDAAAVLAGVRGRYPDIELVGSTSAGEMSSVLGFQEDSVALALFASDTVDITAGVGLGLSEDPDGAARRAIEDARSKTTKDPSLCITTPSIGGRVPAAVLRGLRHELGAHVPILGGGSAPRAAPGAPDMARQFRGDDVVQDAVPVLLFSGPLSYSFGIDTGWTPVGPRGRVTRASESMIHEIDGEPATAFYERYLGAGARPAQANPLAVFEDGAPDFYLRVPVFHEEATGAIAVAGGVGPDAEVQLTVAVTDEIFDGVRSAVSKAIDRYPKDATPEAALVFSCAVRKYLLGSRTGTEFDIARKELGPDLPIFGFYCFGEIAPLESGSDRFHNETIVALLLGAA
jgi:hypothetical protein